MLAIKCGHTIKLLSNRPNVIFICENLFVFCSPFWGPSAWVRTAWKELSFDGDNFLNLHKFGLRIFRIFLKHRFITALLVDVNTIRRPIFRCELYDEIFLLLNAHRLTKIIYCPNVTISNFNKSSSIGELNRKKRFLVSIKASNERRADWFIRNYQ